MPLPGLEPGPPDPAESSAVTIRSPRLPRRPVRVGDNNSKIAQHANQFVHSIDFNHATTVDKACNFHERLFLEAWYAQKDSNAGANILTTWMLTNPSPSRE